MDEAVEAGLLVDALRSLPELLDDLKTETLGPIDPKHTRWKLMALEFWGKDHEDDSGQQRIGPELRLPVTFALHLVGIVKREIEARLTELGVEVA